MNRFMRRFKEPLATIVRPMFHVRNVMGAVWANIIIGAWFKERKLRKHP